MDERAAIVPVTPRSNPTSSYWQDPPHQLAAHRTTGDLPTSTSIVIVGSGITGASIAYNLLAQHGNSSVLMLEARTACSGATGRNGGHTKSASYRAFLDNVRDQGEQEAAKIVRFEYNCVKAVHAFAREHKIDCDSWEGETVDVIYDQGQWVRAQKAISEMKRILGDNDPAAQQKFHDASMTEEMYLVGGALGSVSYEAGSINAYKFVMGVLELALDKGLNLQTSTVVTSINRSNDDQKGWVLETSRGIVRAERVVLATNGYTSYLYPPARGIIVPLRGTVAAMRPGTSLKQELQSTYSFIYANGYEYMIFRPPGSTFAGDLVIGGCSTKAPKEGLYEWGTTDDTTMDPETAQYVKESVEEYFGPQWGEDHPSGRIRKQWTGIMGYSSQGFPLVGLVPDERDFWIAASFQGCGMVLCFHTAKALVTMMNGGDDQKFDDWFPRPFRMSRERLKHQFRGRLHERSPMKFEGHHQ
ncbi:MAG: hypothetical protein L6R41_000137 [Letrouitia leprolyta]|nr:MAG: hypothetical protein L6R41_000137 [Letrouitia leprolyta]